jgi:50S ribosomal protein L16 3-hydroxylase
MDLNAPLALLGGMSPTAFMRRHWQKKPLFVRQALPGVTPPLSRAALFDLAGDQDTESRLVQRSAVAGADAWRVRHGPLGRRALPPVGRPGWTLLVQGLDQRVTAAAEMLERFAFVPHARLDDLMLSWASDGGGVGPHLDSYDVFLLQVQGRRRWQVGAVADASGAAWRPGLPLKILREFQPEQEWLTEPGDLLYLPPGWAHDGVAVGTDCMTCSVGFRAPAAGALAAELLQRLADDSDDDDGDSAAAGANPNAVRARRAARLYRDPRQSATAAPGAIPPLLQHFARQAVAELLAQPGALERALGEVLSEPKPRVWFAAADIDAGVASREGVRLAAATRMVYDARHVFINGESFRAGGRDARLMQRLADARRLAAADCRCLSGPALALVHDWLGSGWLLASAEESR